MRITNNHKTELGLPNGQVLRAGVPTPVRGWDAIKDNAVVAAWVKANILTVDGSDEPASAVSDDKDVLIARLAEFGVKADKRKTVEKLQAMVAEAEEEAAQTAAEQFAELVEDTAREDGGYTAEEFAALSDEDRASLLDAAAEKLKAEAAQG